MNITNVNINININISGSRCTWRVVCGGAGEGYGVWLVSLSSQGSVRTTARSQDTLNTQACETQASMRTRTRG